MARRGDDAAFEAIVQRYSSSLLRHCRRVAGAACAQDALQQALMSAWRALRRDCDVRELRPWLFTIAHRSALAALGEQRRPSAVLADTLAGTRSPVEDLEQGVRAQEALAAIAVLPPLERDALLWTAVHGHSARDTARALEVSESTVRQLVFRGRARTRAAVRVFLPPTLMARLNAAARRVATLDRGHPNGFSPDTGATLLKIAAVVAAGALVGTRMTTLHGVQQHRPERSAPAVGARARSKDPDSARALVAHHAPGRVSTQASLPSTSTRALPASSSTTGSSIATEAAYARLAIRSSSSAAQRPVGHTGAPVVQLPAPLRQVTAPAQQLTAPLRQLTAPLRQVTAPVRLLTAPVRQVVASVAGQLPQMLPSAVQAAVQTGTQQVKQITTDLTKQAADQAQGASPASASGAPLTPIKSLLR